MKAFRTMGDCDLLGLLATNSTKISKQIKNKVKIRRIKSKHFISIMIFLLLLLYSIVYSMLLLIKNLPTGKQSLLLSFKTQVILLKTFSNETRCILYRVAKMNILTKFREIRESRQNIFNSTKVFAIISLLFLFPRQLSRQKSISYKYFCEIFQKFL